MDNERLVHCLVKKVEKCIHHCFSIVLDTHAQSRFSFSAAFSFNALFLLGMWPTRIIVSIQDGESIERQQQPMNRSC